MESFYGGRQGNPFVIVKYFDGINIPQPNENGVYTYRSEYFAYDLEHSTKKQHYYIFDENNQPIIKNAENQFDYSWKLIEKNGQSISNINGVVIILDTELAEGMVQCFSRGGSTTSEVNYGEYVLIDTHSHLYRFNNLEHGQIFRRGMDFENELGGAELVGNIGGPQGETGRGLAVVASYPTEFEIPRDPTIIPEYFPGAAIAVGTSLYIYDYAGNSWTFIGGIGDVNPDDVVRLAIEDSIEEDHLNEDGLWFVSSFIKYAE